MRTRLRLPSPRLLPFTIAVMSALIVLKAAGLAHLLMDHQPTAMQLRAAMIGPPRLIVSSAMAETAAPPAGPPAAAGSAAPMTTAADMPPGKPEAAISDSERGLLQDLRARRAELDARQSALDGRQAVLDATERRLAARVDELGVLQKKLEGLETARKQREEANWSGLVKMYETMKPRDAASIFNDLEMPVLLQIMDRMKDTKMAPVVAAMQTDRAREATTKLAEMRLRQNSISSPAMPAVAPPAMPVIAPVAAPVRAPGNLTGAPPPVGG